MKELPYTQIIPIYLVKYNLGLGTTPSIYGTQHSYLYSQLFVSESALVILAVGASPRAAGLQSIAADLLSMS